MIKRNNTKPKETIVNWSGISAFLTGERENIRQNSIPKKYKDKIDLLLYYIKCWKEGKRLYSMDDIEQVLTKIDLKHTISSDLRILNGEEPQ